MLNEADAQFLKTLLDSLAKPNTNSYGRKKIVEIIKTFLEDREMWEEPAVTAEEVLIQRLKQEGADDVLRHLGTSPARNASRMRWGRGKMNYGKTIPGHSPQNP